MTVASAEPPSATPGRAARDVAIQLAGRAFNLALGVVVTALVVRTLGDAGYGQWSTIYVVLTIADYGLSFGMEPTTVRLAAQDREHEADWLAGFLSLRLLTASAATVVAAVVLLLLQRSDEMLAAGLLMSGTILLGVPSGLRVVFQLRTRNDLAVAIVTLQSVLWGAAVIAIAAGDGGMVWLAGAFLAVVLVVAVAYVVLSRRMLRIPLRFARERWGELLRVGVPVGLSGLLILAYARLDQVIVFQLAGDRDAGLYGAVYRIVEQGAFLPISVMTTLSPLLAAAWPSNAARLARLAQVAAELMLAAALGALAFTLVCAEDAVTLVFGDEFADAAAALPVLTGAFVFICIGYLAGNLVLVLDLQRRFLRLAVIGLVFNLSLNLALVGRYGFMAAAWLALATEALVNVPALALAVRHAGIRPQFGRVARTLVAAAALALSLVGLDAAGAPFGALTVVAALLYPALVLGLGGLDRTAVAALARKRL